MPRVGYYLVGATGGAESGGIGPYAIRLIENMLGSACHTKYHLFIDSAQVSYAKYLQARFPRQNVTWSVVRQIEPLIKLHVPLNWLGVANKHRAVVALSMAVNHLEWQTRRRGVDLIHCPVQMMGLVNWCTPTIVTMHDVQEIHFPGFFTPYERMLRATQFWWSIERATAVVVSFDHVKEDLMRYFRLPSEKIHVCPLPVTADWIPAAIAAPDVLTRNRLAPGFLLYPAQTWPHKNHLGLLRALAHLRDTAGLTPTLVCTGKQNEYFPTIEAELTSLGLQGQVRFLGLVSSEDLVGLYKACRAVVVPTLYEAGSFPVIEAILLDAAVICARVTSLPETIGAAEFTFDPHDPQAMATVIRKILTDDMYYQRNLANATARRAAFGQSVQPSVEAFEALYEATLRLARRC